jgi:hypothetical protein
VAIAHYQLLSAIGTTGTYFFNAGPGLKKIIPLDYAGQVRQAEGEVDICVILLLNGVGVNSNEHLAAA